MSTRTVTATINYGSRPADGAQLHIDLTARDPVTGLPPRNWDAAPVQVQVEDLRGKEHTASLDGTGFQFGTHTSVVDAFADEQEIRDVYYPESVALIKRVTGASHVLVFDHTLRRRASEATTGERDRRPVLDAHADQTPAAVAWRIRQHLPPAEAAARLAKRHQVVNLWRPIAHPALDTPLALCDWRSVDYARDLAVTRMLFPGREGETFAVLANPAHKWKYVSGLRPDEYILIKCSDTKEGVARLTPHTAFVDPSTPADAPPRQSIELRTLVFYD